MNTRISDMFFGAVWVCLLLILGETISNGAFDAKYTAPFVFGCIAQTCWFIRYFRGMCA